MKLFSGGRPTLWTIAVIIGAVVVGALLVLIALGYLIVPASTAAPYEVTGAQVTLQQGTTSDGRGWFGASPTNLTGPPFPLNVTPGGRFTITWTFSNFDGKAHNLSSIVVAAPFVLVSTTPNLPNEVPPFIDSGTLMITLLAPNTPGGAGSVAITVNALQSS